MRQFILISFLLLAACGQTPSPVTNPSTNPSTNSSSIPQASTSPSSSPISSPSSSVTPQPVNTPPELVGKWALQKELYATKGRAYDQFKNEIIEAFRKDGSLPKATAGLNLNGADIPLVIDTHSQATLTNERDLEKQVFDFVLKADELSIVSQTSYILQLPAMKWVKYSQRAPINEAWALLSPKKDVFISFVNEHNPPQPIALSSVLGPEAKESAWRLDVYRKQK